MRGLLLLLAVGCSEEDDGTIEMPPPEEEACVLPAGFPSDGVIVASEADLEAIRDRTELSGLFVCDLPELQALELPQLMRVTAGIAIHRCPRLEMVALPSLESGGYLELRYLPQLISIDFDRLQELTEPEREHGMQILNAHSLADVSFPRLERSASSVVVFNTHARNVELPLLEAAPVIYLNGRFTRSLSLPVLTGTTGISLVGSLELEEVSVPNLRVLHHLEAQGALSLRRLSLPLAERVIATRSTGNLWIEEGTLEELELGRLKRIEGDASLRLLDFTPLASLEYVGGNLRIDAFARGGAIRLESLVEVNSVLGLQSGWIDPVTIDLPRLRRVGGGLELFVESGELSVPQLESAGGFTVERMQTSAFLLPRLNHINGYVMIISTTATTVSMPQLESVNRGLTISSNAELIALELPHLTSVGAEFLVGYNPRLASCEVEAIVERLGENVGVISTLGNDEAASCDP